MTYEVHVHGPDDVLPAKDQADAQRQTDEINALNLEFVSAHVITNNHFSCLEAHANTSAHELIAEAFE